MPDFRAFVRARLPHLDLPRQRELTIVEDLAGQLEDAYEALLAQGLSDEDAWRELQREMPDWTVVRSELVAGEPFLIRVRRRLSAVLRECRGDGFMRDLQSSVRQLVRDRGFAVTTAVTLAVCLGANAAIFTVVYGVLLRPLPVADPDRIVALGDVYPTITPNDILSNTAPSYFDRLEAITSLEEQAMFASWFDTVTIDGAAEELRGMRATPSLFRVLRRQPAIGRAFTDAEGEVGAEHKIILSHGLWQRLFGGDPNVVGRDLRLGWTGRRYTIVGVMPRGFSFFDRGEDGHARTAGDAIQFWIPLAFTSAERSDDARTRYRFFHVGRLRAGATVEQVKAELDALNAHTFEHFPQFGLAELGMYTAVTPLQDALTGNVRDVLYLLWGGAVFVLLIGALNIANLSLARSHVRARELATRLAIGAGRFRVARQLVVEGLMLGLAGGVGGLALGALLLQTLASGGLANLPNASLVRLDGPVVALIAALSAVVGVAIGLVPAASLRRLHLAGVLAEGSRLGTGGRATRLLRRGLVVAQVAGSVVLLIAAGLLLVSFRNLLAVDAGFDAARVTTATIFPPPSRYENERAVVALSDRLLDSVRAIPGVEAAGITSNIALSGRGSPATVSAEGADIRPDAALVLPSVVGVTPGYFAAIGARLVRGRHFTDGDREHALPVAIVDDLLARRLWPNQDPLGKSLRRGDSVRYTVVGVVRSIRFEGLAAEPASVGAAYFPHAQAPPLGRLRWVVVKATGRPAGVVAAVRSALRDIDPDLPLSDIQTMNERSSSSVAAQKLAMALAGMFGLVALFLSVLGLYSVLTYLVARRTREIGIRIALGSTTRGIFRLVFTEGLTLVGIGLPLGVLGAVAAGRVLEGQVFGVSSTDPRVLGTVAVGAGVIAILACVTPARYATRVNPVDTLSAQ